MTTAKKRMVTAIPLSQCGVTGEHYWELFPVPLIGQGETHTIVEVIHSANREHRHDLISDAVPGYYSYFWPLTIQDDKKIPDDFDELFNFCEEFKASGLMRNGQTFRQKDFNIAIKKALSVVSEIAEVHSQNKSQREEK